MIEIKNLSKRYHNHHGSNWVLRDINLVIPSGVSVGLIGANGAGKSTLLRLIAGMDTPERGEVIRHSRVSWPVGLTGGMQGSMTGRQNVKFVARTHGEGEDVSRIVNFVQDFAELGEFFDEPVKTYSSGMRARLSFGLSLAFNFDIYISDEATAVGDRQFKIKARNLFKQKINDSSLIIVSHDESILKELCQACIYLVDSKAIWFDDINKGINQYHNDIKTKVKQHDSILPLKSSPSREKKTNSNNVVKMKDDAYSILRITSYLQNKNLIDHDTLSSLLQLHEFREREIIAYREKTLGKDRARMKELYENLVLINKTIYSIKKRMNDLSKGDYPVASFEFVELKKAHSVVVKVKDVIKKDYETLRKKVNES